MDSHQSDFFREILITGMGKAASILSELARSTVRFSIPSITVSEYDSLSAQLVEFGQEDLVSVSMSFKGIVSGKAIFLLSPESSLILTDMVMDTAEVEELEGARRTLLRKSVISF